MGGKDIRISHIVLEGNLKGQVFIRIMDVRKNNIKTEVKVME